MPCSGKSLSGSPAIIGDKKGKANAFPYLFIPKISSYLA